MTVLPKASFGLQVTRVYNQLGRVQIGGAAALGVLPSTHPRSGEAPAFIPLGKPSDILLTNSIIDRDTNVMVEVENTNPRNSRLIGGVLNGLNDDGTLESGIYYVFLASLDETPDKRGFLNPDDTFLYISNHFISFGVGSDAIRGGRGKFDRPINPRTGRPIKYIRPLRAVYQVQNNRFEPWLMLGESNTVEAYYQFAEWRPYKSCTVEGVRFNADGGRYFDFNLARDPKEFEKLVGANSEQWLGFWHKIPQTHKVMKLRMTYTGTGKIYSSVSRSRGELIAIGKGGEGTVDFVSMSGSDAGGRGMKITTEGDISVIQLYILSTISQQPM